VGMRSLRMLNFKIHGITCVVPDCGLVGKFFAKEKSHERDGSYHLNLYAVREDGVEVLMTQDHIIAKSMGGANELQNLQTMCAPCNCKKGSGRNQSTFKTMDLSHLLRTSYVPLKKNVVRLACAIRDGVATMEDMNMLILALNRTVCKTINTVAMNQLPNDGRTIEEIDQFSQHFTPIGDRIVAVHDDRKDSFYLYNKFSGDRLVVSTKKDLRKSYAEHHRKKK
jgi:hypothetical protein